jgi:DNA-binding CsgD family transcriptional regulator
LPPAWQYPEVTCARLCYENAEYCSADFAESPWSLSANIHDSNGDPIGCIEAFYRKAVWSVGEEPFLPEEHTLIRDVADRVSRALKHMKAESELRQAHLELEREHKALQEVNIALRSVMSRLEEDKRSIQANILSNIRKILMPMVFELELEVSGRQRSLVTLLRQNLQDIASPFLTELTQDHTSLSPTEITICAMIRNGMSTKEIARLRCISAATVRRHRENIRRKLGLRNRKVNLVSYLQSMASSSLGGEDGPVAIEDSAVT